jgi:hypothetical protein
MEEGFGKYKNVAIDLLKKTISILEEYCYDYEKVEVEYAVYDTNVTHDAKWILEK